MFCVSCGAQVAAGARFCASCGSPVTPGSESAVEHRKLVTVLFADIAGSTAMGESLDPEAIRTTLSRHFAAIRAVIERHGGNVEKFIGDAVMAVFGIPEAHEDDALRAVRAAVELQASIRALNAEPGAPAQVAMRVGVNTGEVVTGDALGAETLVTGDTVNTAARLEQAAEVGTILIGAATFRLVTDAVMADPVPPLTVKGKAEPVPAYRLREVIGTEGRRRHLDARLVGRTQEMETLQRAWQDVSAGSGSRLVTVVAAAGVGKSRLVREMQRAVEPASVFVGRCLPYGDGITFWPIRSIVLAAADVDEADAVDVAREKVRRLLEAAPDAEAFAEKVSGGIGLAEVATSQDELFWAIRRTLETISSEPTLIVLEDLHWAEPTLLDLIQYLIDLSSAPMLLLATARPEFLEGRSDWAAMGSGASLLRLEPLASSESDELLDGQAGGEALPAQLRGRILDAAEGNPLFIEEMMAMLREDGLVTEGPMGWQASQSLADVEVPSSIRALLSARLDRLPSEERLIAERASVVGRSFEAAAVSELAPENVRGTLGRHLVALVRKELLRPDHSDLTPGDAFRFRHILIRDAAYEMLPKSERAWLHQRFAAWLERVVGDRVIEFEEILGYHLEQAAGYSREVGDAANADRLAAAAGTHLLAAGLRAARRGDNAAVIPLLTKASTLVQGAARTDALLDLSTALIGAGQHARTQAMLGDLIAEAHQAGDRLTELRARMRYLYSQTEIQTAARNAAKTELLELIDELGPNGPARDLSVAWFGVAMREPSRGDSVTLAFKRALELGLQAGDMRIPSAAAANLSSMLQEGPVPVDDALAQIDDYAAREVGGRRGLAALNTCRAALLAMLGRFDEARGLFHEAITTCQEMLIVDWEIFIRSEFAAAELLAGDVPAAIEVQGPLREDVEVMATMRVWYLVNRAAVLTANGEHQEAIAIADDLLEIQDDEEASAQALAVQASAFHAIGDLAAARSAIDAAIRTFTDVELLPRLGLALLECATIRRDAGDSDWLSDVELARDAFERKGHLVGLGRAAALAESAGGSIAAPRVGTVSAPE